MSALVICSSLGEGFSLVVVHGCRLSSVWIWEAQTSKPVLRLCWGRAKARAPPNQSEGFEAKHQCQISNPKEMRRGRRPPRAAQSSPLAAQRELQRERRSSRCEGLAGGAPVSSPPVGPAAVQRPHFPSPRAREAAPAPAVAPPIARGLPPG